ncbi:MAG: hypothetical protein COB59_01795 [Rhodospirillaceae bacterium]|nr:MAG: hypothetical protein COB59_01795 [Rhodospirillaceae bacterium]
MKILTAFLMVLLFTAPVWAENTAHHDANVHLSPAQGYVFVEDLIQVKGQGKTTFTLSSAFQIQGLQVDGISQNISPDRGMFVVDLGPLGEHQVFITTKALLKTRNTPPFLTAEGGYLGRNWLANPLNFLATWDISGSIDEGQKWLTPGRLSAESEKGTNYTARFSNTQPSPPPTLITGPFEISERWADDIRVRTYFHAELGPLADGYLRDTVRYIQDGIQTIGPYPYSEFSIVSGIAPVGWGLPGLTYIGRRVLALPFIRSTSLPHEVLHNWWGNAVDVDYGSGNWAEGLTTFQADLVQSALKNNDGGRAKRLEWLRNYAALPNGTDIPLSQFRSRTHDALQVVGYGKTAFVFHMLKIRLGAETFNQALQDFYRTHTYNVASWTDLQTAFETASGEDLATFFDIWVNAAGAPSLNLTKAKANGSHVRFTLKQSKAYPLVIPVRVETQKGSEDFQVRLDKRVQNFTFKAKSPVLSLHIDPNFDVFRRLQAEETPPILRDVTLNPETQLEFQAEVKDIALALTKRLLQRSFKIANKAEGPRIVIALNLKSPLESTDAQAWVERDKTGRASLFITAKTAESLSKLARVLPHYKRRSFVRFKDDKVIEKGVWKIDSQHLSKTFK